MEYILILDSGTTYMKAFLFDRELQLARSTRSELKTRALDSVRVEQDAEDYYQQGVACCKQVVWEAGVNWGDVVCLGITNQRGTTVVWGRDGAPLYPAITWQDGRAATTYNAVYSDRNGSFIDRLGRRGTLTPALVLQWIREYLPQL